MFITFDGADGTGKSTLARALVARLNTQPGEDRVVYTCEPTHMELGRHIREVLQGKYPEEQDRLTEYFVEDRRLHNLEIAEQLQAGQTVVCDRYRYSTVVYQHLQGERIERLIELNRDFMAPDYAFILTAQSVDVLLERIGIRNEAKELFETAETLKKALELYDHMKDYFPEDNIILLDAALPTEENVERILKLIGA